MGVHVDKRHPDQKKVIELGLHTEGNKDRERVREKLYEQVAVIESRLRGLRERMENEKARVIDLRERNIARVNQKREEVKRKLPSVCRGADDWQNLSMLWRKTFRSG